MVTRPASSHGGLCSEKKRFVGHTFSERVKAVATCNLQRGRRSVSDMTGWQSKEKETCMLMGR